MTYYEELGVAVNASTEEIREAYKRLARLLHPDKLQDETLRTMAECQMKRLNGLCDTLTNPERRRVYDESLYSNGFTPQPSEGGPAGTAEHLPVWEKVLLQWRGPAGAWVGAVAIAVLILLWALWDSAAGPGMPGRPVQNPASVESSPVRRGLARAPAARGAEQLEMQLGQMWRRLEEMRKERDAALANIGKLEGRLREMDSRPEEKPLPVLAAPPSPGSNFPPVAVAEARPETRRDVRVEPATLPGLAGVWYYPRSHAVSASRDLYLPEFIEASIREEAGMLLGRYRARYRVPDRAISPEVVFQFNGIGGHEMARLPWMGAGGARGEVRLRLLTKDTLEIAWVASDLGSQGLGSGTAVLVRRHDP